MLKSLYIFKDFMVGCIRSLRMDERIISESKLAVKLSRDGDMFKLIEFLCNDYKLSFTDFLLIVEKIFIEC